MGDRLADLADVLLVDLMTRADERGGFTEAFRQSWVPGPPMVQSNLSCSRAGAIRGVHFHRRQADYWCLLEGSAFVALFDLRTGSPTERALRTMTMDAAEGLRGIYVPPGVAHGFCALTDLTLLYLVDDYFTGEDEHGIAWDDPDLGIPWPVADPVLSERDRSNPALADVLRDPPGSGA